MNKVISKTAIIMLVLLTVISASACNGGHTDETLPISSQEATEIGNGEKSFIFEVEADGEILRFNVNTDKTTVGEALTDVDLIEGDQGTFGMYVKKVNGIVADYDVDQTYWGFYIDGEYAVKGADQTEIEEGKIYKFSKIAE